MMKKRFLVISILVLAAGIFVTGKIRDRIGMLGMEMEQRTKEEGTENIESIDSEDSNLQFVPAEEAEAQMILYVEDTRIPEKDVADVLLHIRVPQIWELSNIVIKEKTGDVLTEFVPSELIMEEPNVEIGIYHYYEYSVALSIPEETEGHTAFILYAEMWEHRSDELILYRNITVSDEMVGRLCNVLDETVEYVNSLGEQPIIGKKEGWVVLDPETIPAQVMTYLENREDIGAVWEEDGQIRFTTKDGLSSFFSLTQVYEDENQNYAGSGEGGITQNVDDLNSIFQYDYSFRNVAVDPDVLLMCPLRYSSYSDRKGTSSEEVAEKLADKYEGKFSLVTGGNNGKSTMDKISSGELTEYGTIMMISHGHGNLFDIYSDKTEKTAQSVWDEFMEEGYTDPQYCLNYVSGQGGNGDSSEARLMMGLEYTYLIGGTKEWIKIRPKAHYTIGITPNYFMDIYGGAQFPNTVVYLGICESCNNTDFVDFLISRGCSCVIGYNLKIQTSIEQANCKNIFETMMDVNVDNLSFEKCRNYNVIEARDKERDAVTDFCTRKISLFGQYEFVYEGYGTLSGKVMDSAGTGVCDVVVNAYRFWNGTIQKEKEAMTGKDGTYKFKNLPWGMYLFQAENGVVEDFRSVSFSEEHKSNVDFVLDSCVVNVSVTDETGKFLADANVTGYQDGGAAYVFEMIADKDGNSVFRAVLNAGSYQFSITCEGYEGVVDSLVINESEIRQDYVLTEMEGDFDGLIFDEHYYKVFGIKTTWQEAKEYCERLGGHLLTITNAMEQAAVMEYIPKNVSDTDLWIGLTNLDGYQWNIWITGEVSSYSNWGYGEPDNGGLRDVEQHYGVICNGVRSGEWFHIEPGQWDDLAYEDITNKGYFVCEWDCVADMKE